jgi:predicted nuclease of predicted toxin-antitoxin system
MRILLDECVNPRLRHAFSQHEITTLAEANWLALSDNKLLTLADGRFDVFVTLDQGFEYQHDLRNLSLGIVILHVPKNSLRFYEPIVTEIVSAAETVKGGEVVHVFSPDMRRRKSV